MGGDEQAGEAIPSDELDCLRRIEEAAKNVLTAMEGTFGDDVLIAIAELRAALNASLVSPASTGTRGTRWDRRRR